MALADQNDTASTSNKSHSFCHFSAIKQIQKTSEVVPVADSLMKSIQAFCKLTFVSLQEHVDRFSTFNVQQKLLQPFAHDPVERLKINVFAMGCSKSTHPFAITKANKREGLAVVSKPAQKPCPFLFQCACVNFERSDFATRMLSQNQLVILGRFSCTDLGKGVGKTPARSFWEGSVGTDLGKGVGKTPALLNFWDRNDGKGAWFSNIEINDSNPNAAQAVRAPSSLAQWTVATAMEQVFFPRQVYL